MSGDYSRFVFDPTLDYHGVRLQQGRPLTDWDWNDATAQVNRRQQADSYDTFGQAVVPLTTKDAFAIQLAGSSFSIGPGRLYVDGLLAENHGTGTLAWDPALAEQVGTGWIPYDQQPYYPNAPALPAPGGLNLVYLDVWQREVSWIEAPDLVEPALGVDTTTRLQTVWQVKVLSGIDSSNGCDTPLGQVKGWADRTAPSAGLLTTVTGAPTSDDPCQIPPAGGYKGLENQLYRIEINDGGVIGKATFKWSRNNASVVANVTKLIDTKTLVVDSVGRDSVLRFNDGDWVEITDDWRELNNLPGEMHRIAIGGGVDDATRTITLTTDINAAWFPSGTLKDRHTRLKRWDQQGKVLNADGSLYLDLDTTADGLIPVPKAGQQIALESGILINFDLAVAGGQFRSGDYWMVAARAATADIDHLTQAPPRGIHHHYAKLGYTTLSGTPQDCRQFWPTPSAGDGCSCTICVTPAGHNGGSATIQQAINTVIKNGGGTVCLEPGTYNISSTLNLVSAPSLRIRGQGLATQLYASVSPAIRIEGVGDLALEDFALQVATATPTSTGIAAGSTGIAIGSSSQVSVSKLYIASGGEGSRNDTAIQLGGRLKIAEFNHCVFSTATGIATLGSQTEDKSYSGDTLRIVDNLFTCATGAVNLPRILSPAQLFVLCSGNDVSGASDAGFRFGSSNDTLGRIEITDNRLLVGGNGIITTFGGLDIRDNEIHFRGENQAGAQTASAISIGDFSNPATQFTVLDAQVTGNRISDFKGLGIGSALALGNGLIKSNLLERVGAGIALMTAGSGPISIENNLISDVTGFGASSAALVFGIMVNGASSLQIRDNQLARLGSTAAGTVYAEAIATAGCQRVAIDGNTVTDLAPQSGFKGAAVGIAVQDPFTDAAVRDNQISRNSGAGTADNALWSAIGISGSTASAASQTQDQLLVAKRNARKVTPPAASLSPIQSIQAKLPSLVNEIKLPIKFAAPAAPAIPAQRAQVRGNQVSGYGGMSIIDVQGVTDCDCSGNQSDVLPVPGTVPAAADVALSATALIVNGNRIQGSSNSLSLKTTSKFAAVVGNITAGHITLDGSSLPAPWSTLNVSGF